MNPGDFDLTIGSGEDCDYRIDREDINPRHATLRRRGDRLFLRDEGSVRGTYINNTRIPPRRWKEITRYDTLRLSTHLIDMPNLFQGRSRMGIDTTEIRFSRHGRELTRDVFLRAKPGTLTAIMGPSGCGKSVFLKLLCGYYQPDQGHILYGDELVSQAEQTRIIREFTGYVPQAEILLPELTVHESLDYRLRLKFPDMHQEVREKLIQKVCQNLGFTGNRLTTFLHTRIGAPDSTGNVLSGGERRRASIAHELILQPLVLFLDEPTTGLSSSDADELVGLLSELAKTQGMTIVMTVHQPSREAYQRFDSLLLLGLGGRCLYHGPAHQALGFFGINPRGLKSPGDLLIREIAHFQESNTQQDTSKFPFQPYQLEKSASAQTPQRGQLPKPSPALFGNHLLRFVLQWWILLLRGFRVLAHDRVNLTYAVVQVPLIAVLILVGFQGAAANHRGSDITVSTIRNYQDLKAKAAAQSDFPWQNDAAILREAVRQAEASPTWMSEPQARQKATVYFILTLCGIWFGLLGSCKEIVTEQEVIRRESRTGVHLVAVFLAKFFQQGLVAGLQMAGVLLLVQSFLLQLEPASLGRLWFYLLLGVLASTSLGLLVSASVGTYRAVLTIIPLLMVPQVIFGGMLRTLDVDSWARLLSWPTISRWTFEFCLSTDPFANRHVLRLLPPSQPDHDVIGTYSLLQHMVKTSETGLLDLLFPQSASTSQIGIYLHLMIVFFLILSIIVLYYRFQKT